MPTARAMRTTAAVMAALLLGACGSDDQNAFESSPRAEETSSPTPSPSTPSDPDSATALEVVEKYEAHFDRLMTDPSQDHTTLGSYATGLSYDRREFAFLDARRQGMRRSGRSELVDPVVSRRDKSTRIVRACVDYSDVTITDRKGKKQSLAGKRYVNTYTVTRSQDGRWRVEKDEETAPTC